MTQTDGLAHGLQPLFADRIVVLSAPTQVWSRADGEIGATGGADRPTGAVGASGTGSTPGTGSASGAGSASGTGRASGTGTGSAWGMGSAVGIDGIYHGDVRVFSGLRLCVGGRTPEPIAHSLNGARAVTFTSLLRHLDDRSADPRVRLDRTRTVTAAGLTETFTLTSALSAPLATDLTLTLTPDFAEMQAVKAGQPGQPGQPNQLDDDGLPDQPNHDGPLGQPGQLDHDGPPGQPGQLDHDGPPGHVDQPGHANLPGHADRSAPTVTVSGTRVTFASGTVTVTVEAPGADVHVDADGRATLTWGVRVGPRGSVTAGFSAEFSDEGAVVAGAPSRYCGERVKPVIRSGDSRLASWLSVALDDLDALRMVRREQPADPFLAAGAPWFFTLFGRDSIWAARFLLPFDLELAASTLRALAALQGTQEVAATAEQPGKIMHELRPGELRIPGENVALPPLYYGTVDATPLWVVLLGEAWHWGLPDEQVEALLPNLVAALEWMRDYGDSDGDGFLEYVDSTGHGLTNQGWKDSGDSIQWQSGGLAVGPIALCEVQGYAYQAAITGAGLLEHFGRDGSEWRAWADALKQRFADAFWVDSPAGRYPAVALDAAKRPVDSVTSNIGHLLGTGIVTPDDARCIARRLTAPDMNSGFGLRTMSSDSAGFWPLSYHGGSVWAHDTAIAIAGLGREGLTAEAADLSLGLLAAAESFGYRMPELHSGDARTTTSSAIPYPAACRPQAWSAAAAVSVLSTLAGLAPDAASPFLATHPISPPPAGALHVQGLRYLGATLTLSVAPDGIPTLS